MGETWSVPTVAFVDRAANTTNRKPAGVDFVLYVGSGYGDTSGCGSGGVCEGQAFFTLDALTGDVVEAADIPAASGTPDGGYANSLVANAVSFNPGEFQAAALGSTGHPASSKVERAYIGDLHGRVWKFLSSDPGTPLLVTDLGIEQPIAAAGSRARLRRERHDRAPRLRQLGLRPAPGPGEERRALRPRRHQGRRDDGSHSGRRLPAEPGRSRPASSSPSSRSRSARTPATSGAPSSPPPPSGPRAASKWVASSSPARGSTPRPRRVPPSLRHPHPASRASTASSLRSAPRRARPRST